MTELLSIGQDRNPARRASKALGHFGQCGFPIGGGGRDFGDLVAAVWRVSIFVPVPCKCLAALCMKRGWRRRSGLYRCCKAACPRAQSCPWLTGWAGLPSIFSARPPIVRTNRPQPAGHIWQTVAKYCGTPSMKPSGWFR